MGLSTKPMICTRVSLPVLFFFTLLAPTAASQADVDKPLPNVMLLVDTSGSMEWKASVPEFPTCNPGEPTQTNQKSRWIDLVEVLTGTFENYSCFAQDRKDTAFADEFSLFGTLPYDFQYVNPYHRAMSGGCVVGPGVAPPAANPYEYPEKSINTFAFSAPNTVERPVALATHPGCSGFVQAPDGILDIFSEKVRFGLMTFDTHIDAGDGINGAGTTDSGDGMEGTWSYFLNDTPTTGRPAQCAVDQPQEVGARNAAAPPWEGRMIAFGAPSAPGSETRLRSERMQKTLLATRPYGATPIAALLDDARQFFWHDASKDPADSSLTPADFGPRSDPQTLVPNCRRSISILLSDGEPNLDLRPYCENTIEGGRCPYEKPEDIAWSLYNNPANDPDQRVELVVIGFAMGNVTPQGGSEIGCEELTDEDCVNNPDDRRIQACCNLNRIAAAGGAPLSNGGTRKAYFPQNAKELRRTFSSILSDVTTTVTTRTSPVFSSASAGAGGNTQFSTGFIPVLEQPWRGTLTRTRILCDGTQAKQQPIDETLGDDFARNMASGAGPERRFFTVISDESSRDTIRPSAMNDDDGLASTTGSQTALLRAANFVQEVNASKLEITGADCDAGDAVTCRDAIVSWNLGLTNSEGETRCPSTGTSDCHLLGAIYRSTPRVVPGVPNDFLQDESYTAFVQARVAEGRPSVLYTATADGMLHAFKTAPQISSNGEEVNTMENNELWAFLPPAVLPAVKAQYPNTPAVLLDGPPIVKDVIAQGTDRFVRTADQARAGEGNWRTVLAQGFGGGQVDGGYFALDITTPTTANGGPRFLWQLTRDSAGNQLFGRGGTPTITTIFYRGGSTGAGQEVAVAILPGGDAGARTGEATDAGPRLLSTDQTFEPAPSVNEYSDADAARTLTIVRLDTGEILRTFRPAVPASGVPSSEVTTVVDIPAPIVGQPAAFPAATGAVADRLFVGDKEGRVWRVDVSNASPEKWTMEVFLDAFFDMDRSERQPIETAPILSVDEIGQITVATTTGEQAVQAPTPGMRNRVISATEVLDENNRFRSKVNWVETLGCASDCGEGQSQGERVTGPMSLFGSTLYFASSAPALATSSECSTGTSRVWGVHYTRSFDEAAAANTIDPMNGAAGALPQEDESTAPKSTEPTPGVIFGVSIEQQPTCSIEQQTVSTDPYLGGYGSHTSVSAVTPGDFSLVYQVGGGEAVTNNSQVMTERLGLESPANSVFVDSWAPIFE